MKVNNSKNGRFSYEMISETQPEIEFLEAVTFIYPLAKSGVLNPICNQNLILQISIVGFDVHCQIFLKKDPFAIVGK